MHLDKFEQFFTELAKILKTAQKRQSLEFKYAKLASEFECYKELAKSNEFGNPQLIKIAGRYLLINTASFLKALELEGIKHNLSDFLSEIEPNYLETGEVERVITMLEEKA